METLKYGFRIFQLLITIGVVVIAGLLMLTVLPIRGNLKLLTVLSGSMEPAIAVGSAVVIKPAKFYNTDEVITFEQGRDNLVTHRIVAKQILNNKKQYFTKGDANEEMDSWVISEEQIKGKVWMALPYVGYLTNWVKQPAGFVVLIILPAAILIYGELVAVKGEIVKWWMKRNKLLVFSFWLLVAGTGFWTRSWASQDGGLKTTRAWMVDQEVSNENVIGVATCFEDCEVEVSPTPTLTPTQIPVATAQESIKLNEFVANGEQPNDSDEWIELYNLSSQPQDISGWKLNDAVGIPYTIPVGTLITGNGFLVFTRAVTGIALNNVGGDTLILLASPDDALIDSHTYTNNPSVNQSIGRQIDGGLPWKTCTVGTQGGINSGNC